MVKQRLVRAGELLLAFTGLGVALLAAYVLYVSIRDLEKIEASKVAAVVYLVLILAGTVIVLGLRLAFARLRPGGRIVGSTGIAGYAVLCTALFALAWWRDGRFPPQAWGFIAGATVSLILLLILQQSRHR